MSVLHVIEQTENGLVEAVAVLISKTPRLRPELETGRLGECYKAKPDFVKVNISLPNMNISVCFLKTFFLSYFTLYLFHYIGLGEMEGTHY